MRVLRHEESPEACPLTCNGKFDNRTAWSKTMVGYDTEDRSFALELTYTYGVTAYTRGGALRDLGIRLRRPLLDVLTSAVRLGYGPAETNGTSTHLPGPDGYRWVLMLPTEVDANNSAVVQKAWENLEEPFDHVRLMVRSLHASVEFYTKYLGMAEYTDAANDRAEPSAVYVRGMRVVGYAGAGSGRSAVPLFLEANPSGSPMPVEPWDGRHAIALPAAALRAAFEKIERELGPTFVVHALREQHEALGTLLIAVVRDPDGLEICLVSAETFDAAAKAADDFAEPDWEHRKSIAQKLNVPLAPNFQDPNKPVFDLEELIKKYPKEYKEAREQAEKENEEAKAKYQDGENFMAKAKELLEANDMEALAAMDWEHFEKEQAELKEYVAQTEPPKEVVEKVGKVDKDRPKRRRRRRGSAKREEL